MPRLFRNKKKEALSPLPGKYSEDEPLQAIFDTSTRLRVEANHWKTFCFILVFVAGGAILTRNPAPSLVKVFGVSADTNGNAVVRELVTYKPSDQEIRKALHDTVVSWFTIEPVLSRSLNDSRMAKNINAVRKQMTDNARNQFGTWIKNDAPFTSITLNPRLVREPKVTDVSLLDDSTAVVQFTTSTSDNPTATPVTQSYALTIRYQIVPPTSVDALTANPFGVFYPYFTLQKTQ
ncbi:type IV secretion system protein VirB5 [Robbsia andropogonis]|uniref:type IV secretion system protein n=1 Tax=Robbsia andropogonis TaxID=28092 RepID=UPI002A6AE31C|nr:type IV secretion system protein [Robbsia andropogonis]